MTPADYIRSKAQKMRDYATNQRKDIPTDERDQLVHTARHMEVVADEIEAGFHDD